MKTVGIVLALLCVTGVAAVAETATFDVYAGWTTISAPLVPINSEPSAVFTGLQWEGGAALKRWDSNIGWVEYDYWSAPDANFGGILLGDGYLAYNDLGAKATCSYTGLDSGVPSNGVKTDMWISLPKAGWNLVGFPYNTSMTIDQDTGAPLSFTDGVEVASWADALAKGWLAADSMQSYNGASWQYTGFNYGWDDQLTPSKGYYIYTKKDNLAMIITAP